MQVWSLGEDNPLEGMATHSSILAWRVPMDSGAGRLQLIGLQRVGHEWSDLAPMHTAYKLNKQGDNIEPWHTPFPIWKVCCCMTGSVVSCPAYRFRRRQVRWSGKILRELYSQRNQKPDTKTLWFYSTPEFHICSTKTIMKAVQPSRRPFSSMSSSDVVSMKDDGEGRDSRKPSQKPWRTMDMGNSPRKKRQKLSLLPGHVSQDLTGRLVIACIQWLLVVYHSFLYKWEDFCFLLIFRYQFLALTLSVRYDG